MSLYGVMALFLQKQPFWFCVYSTLAFATIVAFGMGLSAGIRADCMIVLPSLCSVHGRNFLLYLFVSLLLYGPLTNMLENTKRAANSLLCGAELAANQTQELMQRAAAPLFSVLDKIRQLTSNAMAVAGRVQNFISALTDSIRHIARTLRNVLHFLADIGDICNDKLGSPYRKCRAVFSEARADCSERLGDFNFLCDIVDGFQWLCNIARAGELFCVIPSYIADHLKKRLADPVLTAFEHMKREFDFNISGSVTFDLDASSNKSLQEITHNIMEEVSSDLQFLQMLFEPLKYCSLILLAFSFLRARWYRQRYLSDINFENVYVSTQLVELDQQMTLEDGASVMPITLHEAKTYITPLSLTLTNKEQRAILGGVVSVVKHMVIGGLLLALDFIVFWMLDQVHHHATGDVVARVPFTMSMQVNGSGYASDIFRDLVASFNVLQQGNITVISKKCLLEPSEPSYATCFILGFLLGLALLITVTGAFMRRCSRLICACYYPERELERLRFLRQKILDERRAVGRALRTSATRNLADGGGREESHLRTLLLRLPGGGHLSNLLGLSSVTCLACSERVGPEDDNMVICDVQQCPGVYCRPCYHSLGNTCVVCTRPLVFQEDGEEELDSSDDEQLNLWTTALISTHITDPGARALMERRISMTAHQGPSEISEADMIYQSESGSESDTSSYASLEAVVIHSPQPVQDPVFDSDCTTSQEEFEI
ncbi:DC-STAMP domain-containing protein 2 [Aulostomus maculatus]